MRHENDPIARMTYLAGLVREALQIADEVHEYLLAAKLDETLACVRDRIGKLKSQD